MWIALKYKSSMLSERQVVLFYVHIILLYYPYETSILYRLFQVDNI